MKDAHQPVGDEGSPASTNLGGFHVDSGGGGEHSGTDERVGGRGERCQFGRIVCIWITCLQALKLAGSRLVKICLKCGFWSKSSLINYKNAKFLHSKSWKSRPI